MKWKFCSKTIYEYWIKMSCTFFLIFERKNLEKHLCFIENFTDYFAFILSALKYYFLNQCIYTVGEIIICAPKLRNNFWCTIKLLDFLLVALNLFDFFFSKLVHGFFSLLFPDSYYSINYRNNDSCFSFYAFCEKFFRSKSEKK